MDILTISPQRIFLNLEHRFAAQLLICTKGDKREAYSKYVHRDLMQDLFFWYMLRIGDYLLYPTDE